MRDKERRRQVSIWHDEGWMQKSLLKDTLQKQLLNVNTHTSIMQSIPAGTEIHEQQNTNYKSGISFKMKRWKGKEHVFRAHRRLNDILYSLVQWNWFSDVTECMKLRGIQWHKKPISLHQAVRMCKTMYWGSSFFSNSSSAADSRSCCRCWERFLTNTPLCLTDEEHACQGA